MSRIRIAILGLVLAGCTRGAEVDPPASDTPPPSSIAAPIHLGAAMPHHPDAISALAVDARGDLLVAATQPQFLVDGRPIGIDDPGVRIWSGGRLRDRIGDDQVVTLALSTARGEVATADRNGTVRNHALTGELRFAGDVGAHVVALHFAGDAIVVVRFDGSVTWLDATSGQLRARQQLGAVASAAAFADDVVLVAGSAGAAWTLRLADPSAPARVLAFGGAGGVAAAIDPGATVAFVGDDVGAIRRMDLGSGAIESLALASGWPTRALAWMPGGDLVVSTSIQGQYLWVVAPDGAVASLPADDGPFDALAVAGDHLLAGASSGAIRRFDVPRRRELLPGLRHTAGPRALGFTADARSLVVYARPTPLRWDLARARATELPTSEPWPKLVMPGATRAVVDDGELGRWAWHDVGTTTLGPWHDGLGFETVFAALDPTTFAHAHAEDDGAHVTIEGPAGAHGWTSATHLGVRGLAAAPGGTRWVTLDRDDRPHVWTPDGALVCRSERALLNAEVAFVHTDRELVVISQGAGIAIWDADRCVPMATLYEGDGDRPQGSSDAAWSLASHHGRGVFATGHASGTVRLWSSTTRAELWARVEHHALIDALSFDEAGLQLASMDQGGGLVVWPLAP